MLNYISLKKLSRKGFRSTQYSLIRVIVCNSKLLPAASLLQVDNESLCNPLLLLYLNIICNDKNKANSNGLV